MTGKTAYTHPVSSLRWYRLPVTLLNIRSLPGKSAHPVSVFQAIIKGVSLSIGKEDEPLVIFHIRNRRHHIWEVSGEKKPSERTSTLEETSLQFKSKN